MSRPQVRSPLDTRLDFDVGPAGAGATYALCASGSSLLEQLDGLGPDMKKNVLKCDCEQEAKRIFPARPAMRPRRNSISMS